jgi:hypothetical protein
MPFQGFRPASRDVQPQTRLAARRDDQHRFFEDNEEYLASIEDAMGGNRKCRQRLKYEEDYRLKPNESRIFGHPIQSH